MGTHEVQRSPVNSAVDTLDFMQHIQSNVSAQSCDTKLIINIDQTSVSFTSHLKKTLEWRGAKSVNICTSMNDTKKSNFG